MDNISINVFKLINLYNLYTIFQFRTKLIIKFKTNYAHF